MTSTAAVYVSRSILKLAPGGLVDENGDRYAGPIVSPTMKAC
jgi:hypothetical protein